VALLFVAALAIAAGVLGAQAVSRGRALERLRELTSAPEGVDVEQRVRQLQDQTEAARWEASQVERDLAYLADLVGVGIVHLSDDMRVDVANTAAHVFLGRPPGSLRDKTAMEAFVDARIEAVAEAANETGAATAEVMLPDGGNETLTVRARRSPVRGIWLVLEDVSELRRLQQIRAEFIDNLSHELRTPLTNLSLLAETLSREAEVAGESIPPRMYERIGKIEVETGYLVQMVNEMLDLTRIESGGPLLLLDLVDMTRLASTAVERLRLFAERQGVTLAVDAAAELPPVRGAEDRLAQVLVNLIHNAVKFSPGGGTVTVHVRHAGDEVLTAVEDRGIGIPRSAQARIFERFYKVDRARVRSGGTGLGLAIARHVVEQHQGRIWVDSTEGAGSTFSFALPTAPVEAGLAPVASTPVVAEASDR
jgi:two-component system phosphate regulon sensor histidine kinase PhoR